MLHSHSRVPLMKAFEQHRLQLESVVRGRIRHSHQLGEDKQHKQVVFVAAGARHGTRYGAR